MEKGDKAGPSSGLNQELVQALKESYPDQATMPTKVREILEKQTSVSAKQLNTDMKKATGNLVKARNHLKGLQENRARHRHSWLKHLSSTLQTWTEHMTSYDRQQQEFHTSIRAARRELASARSVVQELNQKAGKVSGADSDQEDLGTKDQEVVVKEEAVLRAQINGLIERCVKGAEDAPKNDVDVDIQAISDSETDAPVAKRARSVDAPPAETEAVEPVASHGG